MLRFARQISTEAMRAIDGPSSGCLQRGKWVDQAAFAGKTREQQVRSSTSNDVRGGANHALHHAPASQPFAWQNGEQLLLLDLEHSEWLVAELAFDATECLYFEKRRATYMAQREAIGALLSRALASGESALIDTVEQLDAYMTRHYNVSLINA